ncbi:MAG: ABC transporter permease, partial [Candidatus Rokuibacteriota bacterium]
MNGSRLSKYAMVAPAVVLIVSLTIFPVLYLLWISLLDWDLQRAGRAFVGLAN